MQGRHRARPDDRDLCLKFGEERDNDIANDVIVRQDERKEVG